jgi:hypothetical protein
MNASKSWYFWQIRKADPIIIKVSKVFLWIDFAIVAGLMLSLDFWAKRVADSTYSYEIVMRGGSAYYVTKLFGFIMHGGMILWPIIFIFTFSYFYWPPTKKEKMKRIEEGAREEKEEIR